MHTLRKRSSLLLDEFRSGQTHSSAPVEGIHSKARPAVAEAYGFKFHESRQAAVQHALGARSKHALDDRFSEALSSCVTHRKPPRSRQSNNSATSKRGGERRGIIRPDGIFSLYARAGSALLRSRSVKNTVPATK